VCKALGLKKKQIRWDERLYGGDTKRLFEVLGDFPKKAKTVPLVGHNPGLKELLTYLCGRHIETPRDGKLLPTAAVAHLRLPKGWKRLRSGRARMLSVTRPPR
jgi:phosphohistidine phosphatase